MCGIVGVIYKDPQQQVNAQRLEEARETLAHRGPDAAGLWHRPGIALAHRRLAILDLNNAPGHGQQPMADADNNHALTYNGEVYNYQQLMADREKTGQQFQSTCDTELVFQSLVADGANAIHDFHGMFALAFYQHTTRNLLLVRDRLGQKPLYYHDAGDAFIFASELKAILAFTQARYELDPAAIEQFFTRGYILSPRTIFQNIHKLPAGCKLSLDANTWQCQVEQWWDASPQDLGSLTDESAVDTLDELLTQSVTDRLISDVPIGTLLSGGIDSSLITAMASKATDTPIKAFTLGFADKNAFNEMPYAQLVAEQYGCDWLAKEVDQDTSDWLSELEDASQFYDEPFGNFTVTAQRTLSKLCRQQLTVVLTGQGGDELTAGYAGRYNWVAQTESQATDASKRSQYAPAVDDVLNHLNKTSFVTWPNALSQMFSSDFAQSIAQAQEPTDTLAPFWNRHDWTDRLGNVLYTDAKTNLPDYLVCIEERAAMSASLEARNPMLDHRVVEFLLSLPMHYKIRPVAHDAPMAANGLQNKWILHALANRYLPTQAFDRPKRGFTPPIQQWVQQHAPRIANTFRATQTLTAGLYNDNWQRYLNTGQYEPQATMPIYYALVFALWAKRYADHIQLDSLHPRRMLSKAKHRIPPAPTHTTFREQQPESLATARWFCQMLGNLPPKGTAHITGDPSGFYTTLAKRSGYRIAEDNQQSDARILLGLDAVTTYLTDATPKDAGDATQLLVFIPFKTSEQTRVLESLEKLNTQRPIQGHQAVPISNTQAVLIARCAALIAKNS